MRKDRKLVLLESGTELLSEKTFSEISMDGLAERSGITKPMIYYYFGNKEGYFRALAKHLLSTVRSMVMKVYDPELSLRENLLRYVRFRMKFVEEHPRLSRAFISMMRDPNIGMLIDEIQQEFDTVRVEFVKPLFDKAEERGEIRPGVNSMMVMMMLNSLMVSYTLKKLGGVHAYKMDPVEVVDMIFHGIANGGKDGAVR